jgi:hypothetical protein
VHTDCTALYPTSGKHTDSTADSDASPPAIGDVVLRDPGSAAALRAAQGGGIDTDLGVRLHVADRGPDSRSHSAQ